MTGQALGISIIWPLDVLENTIATNPSDEHFTSVIFKISRAAKYIAMF